MSEFVRQPFSDCVNEEKGARRREIRNEERVQGGRKKRGITDEDRKA